MSDPGAIHRPIGAILVIAQRGITLEGVAVTPDGTRVYVTNQGQDGFSVIGTATNTEMGYPVALEGPPHGVAVNPVGTRVYVGYGPAGFSTGGVWVLDTTTGVEALVPVDGVVKGVAVNPAGRQVYATHSGTIFSNLSQDVLVIDTATNTVTATVPVGDGPYGVAVNPAGTRVYVANNLSDTVSGYRGQTFKS